MEEFTHIVTWWHWAIAGVVLLIVEVLTMTFLFAGFALAAFAVAILMLLFAMPFWMQMLIWSILAVLVFVRWRRYEAHQSSSDVGQADMGLRVKGTVVEPIEAGCKGIVRFDTPVLGNSEWIATADKPIEAGERVRIVDVAGQLIKVSKEG